MLVKHNGVHLLTNMSSLGEHEGSKILRAILNIGANALTPRQVSQQMSHQLAESQLSVSLRRLFTEVQKDWASVDFRRVAVKVRRAVSSAVSKAMRRLDAKGEPQLHVLEYTYPLVVPVPHGVVFLFVRFVFFFSVGYVHMGEPTVRHGLV